MRRPATAVLLSLVAFAMTGAAQAAPFDAEGFRGLAEERFGSQVQAVVPHGTRYPSLITGLREMTEGPDLAARASWFLERHAALLGLAAADFRVVSESATHRSRVVRLRQMADGLEVADRGATVVFDESGRQVRSVHLNVAEVSLAPAEDLISHEEAEALARAEVAGQAEGVRVRIGLTVLAGPPARRAYQVLVPTIIPLGQVSVFVDAATGETLWLRRDSIHRESGPAMSFDAESGGGR